MSEHTDMTGAARLREALERTRVIAAFPATGKSYVARTVPGWADSDSSRFSWKYRHPDVRERHPDWPGNYITHLRELLKSDLRVLVSTHAEVRDALVAAGIPFTLVYPRADLREEYRARMQQRGSPPALIAKVVDELWPDALEECARQTGCEHVVLGPGEYLREALAAVPEVPEVYEWRALYDEDGESCAVSVASERGARLMATDGVHIERRTPAVPPGPWERVEEGSDARRNGMED